MKIIANNRNEKDFQSMIFETDLTWKRRKEKKVSINYNWDNHLNDCNCMVKK